MTKPKAAGQEYVLHPVSGKKLGYRAYEEWAGHGAVRRFAVIPSNSSRQRRIHREIVALCRRSSQEFNARFKERTDVSTPAFGHVVNFTFGSVKTRRHNDGKYWLIELFAEHGIPGVPPKKNLHPEDFAALTEKLSEVASKARRISMKPA